MEDPPTANSNAADAAYDHALKAEATYNSLVRKCLKRSLDLFVGNYGMRPLSIPEAHEQHVKIKKLNEYGPILETDGATSADGPFRERSLVVRRGVEEKAMLLSAPGAAALNSSKPSTTKSGAVDALQHLDFSGATSAKPRSVWHPQWKLMRVISGHQGWVRCLAIDPSNEWFASGGNDRLIKIWDLASGTLKLSLTGHINTVTALELSKRHPYLFSAAEDNEVKCWDLEYNKVIRNYHGHLSGVYCLTVHPALDVLASGGRDAVVRLWDMRTKQAIHILSGHQGTVMSLASQTAEPQLISGSMDRMIRCWDLAAGRSSVVLTHHKKGVRGLAIHPSEYTFCSAAADNVKVWRCPQGRFERDIHGASSILHCVGIKSDAESAVVVAGSDQGSLYFWDWRSGTRFQKLDTKPQPGSLSSENAIFDLKFDMSETRLLTAECDKTIKIWREDPASVPNEDA